MNHTTTKDCIDDALFRAGEPTDGTSDYHAKSIEYANRIYQAVLDGGAELHPMLREDWIWLYKKGLLTLVPAFNTGSVSVTKGLATVTFSTAPVDPLGSAISVQGRYLRVQGHSDVFVISSHIAGQTAATLDSTYTGDTASAPFECMPLEYDLAADVIRLNSPMWTRSVAQSFPFTPGQIHGIDIEALRSMWPTDQATAGIPSAFAQISESRVRFSAAPASYLRVEYDYKLQPTALTYSDGSIPVIPYKHRRILADGVLMFLFIDKNDDRVAGAENLVKQTLEAMSRENRHRRRATDGSYGKVYPRLGPMNPSIPFRTSGGLIVG